MTAAVPDADGTSADSRAADAPVVAAAPRNAQEAAEDLLRLEQPSGRIALFLQAMFGLTLVAAIYAMWNKLSWIDRAPGLMLFGIGVFAIVAIRRLGREAVVRIELLPAALRVVRRGGHTSELALQQLLLVRMDVGPDDELAYALHFVGDRHLRLVPPEREEPEALQTFIEQLAGRAGLTWTGTHAKRA